jgi:hypothetical protein
VTPARMVFGARHHAGSCNAHHSRPKNLRFWHSYSLGFPRPPAVLRRRDGFFLGRPNHAVSRIPSAAESRPYVLLRISAWDIAIFRAAPRSHPSPRRLTHDPGAAAGLFSRLSPSSRAPGSKETWPDRDILTHGRLFSGWQSWRVAWSQAQPTRSSMVRGEGVKRPFTIVYPPISLNRARRKRGRFWASTGSSSWSRIAQTIT